MGGRPSAMTEERCAKILQDIADGVPKTKAISSNGVCEKTGYNWANNDPVFSRLMEQAEDTYEANAIKKIGRGVNSMGDPDWKATATLLKMRRPEYRDKGVEVKVEATASVSSTAITRAEHEQIQNLRRIVTSGGGMSN